MSKKIEVTPGKLTALQAKGGIVVISLFLVFGLALGYVAMQDAHGEDSSFAIAIGAFFLVWIVACVSIIIYFSRVLKSASNSPADSLAEIRIEGDEAPADFETRLRRLENLKKDGLISEEEYRLKRSQILKDKW